MSRRTPVCKVSGKPNTESATIAVASTVATGAETYVGVGALRDTHSNERNPQDHQPTLIEFLKSIDYQTPWRIRSQGPAA